MPIKFRHDAAAVVPPSNQTTRKYGQNLVQQQNQQKYHAQQQGYDRLFTLGRDAIQSRDQAIRQGQQNAFQTIRDVNQQSFLTERDEAQNKFLSDQQRAKDFASAQDRIGVYAQDALNNPETPPELRQKIRDLVGAKSIAMGRDFNEVQQQEFLKDYNAQLAGYLSQIPPPKPKPTRDEELKNFLGPNYDTYKDQPWVPDGKGGFAIAKDAQLPQKPPTTAEEAFKADPKTEAKFMEEAKTIVGKGKPIEDEAGYGRAVILARKLWERSNTPSEFGGKGSTSSASYYNAPDSGVPAAPQAPPAAASPDQGLPPLMPGAQDDLMSRLDAARGAQAPQAGPGMPPAPGSQPTQSQVAWDAIYGAQQAQNPQAAPGLIPGQQAQPGLVDAIKGQPAADAGQSPISQPMALAPGHPDYKAPPTPTGTKRAMSS